MFAAFKEVLLTAALLSEARRGVRRWGVRRHA